MHSDIGASYSATTSTMAGSISPAEMSLTITGPNVSSTRRATSARNVSTETGGVGAIRRTAATPASTTPLLLGRHLGGSGPGGVASDVEQIATGIGRFADTPFDNLGIRCAAAGEKESGVTLTIAITRGVVKSGRMFSVFIA